MAARRDAAGVDVRALRAFAREVGQTLISANRSDFELGRQIQDVAEHGYWKAWPLCEESADLTRFQQFEDWAWAALGFSRRKAERLARNYVDLRALDPAPDTLARALRQGWSKIGHILRVARNETGLLRWLDYVEQHRLTELELRSEIALALAPQQPAGQVPAGLQPVADDAGAAADAAGPGPGPGAGREPIAPAGPAGGVLPPEGRRVKLPVVFEDADAFKITMRAVAAAQRQYGQMGVGRALALIATAYMGTVVRDDEGGPAVAFDYMVQAIEHTYGVRLQLAPESPAPRAPDRFAAVITPEPLADAAADL